MSPHWGIPYGMKRGQLRIYLGAAPGVGKTYAMLGEGHRRLARGTDVVVGFAETYNRKLTAQLLGGLEIVPRRGRRRGTKTVTGAGHPCHLNGASLMA